jgi:hypothetical protein
MRTLVIALALLAPAAARAGNEITVGSASRTLTSSSASAVATDSLAGAAFAYAHELVAFAPRVALWVEGELAAASSSGTLFQTMSTGVHELALDAGARLRYTPWRHVVVAARLDVGAARTALDLTDASGHTATDAGWAPIVRLGGAVDLLAVDRARFAFGLRVEGGYVAAPGPTLAPTPGASSDDPHLAMTTSSIGRLDLGGPYVAFALACRF